MPNLIRLKQIDQPEISGYVLDVTDGYYYEANNPSGFISSVSSDSAFLSLSGNLISTGYTLNSSITSLSGTLSSSISSTGINLTNQINSLSGVVNSLDSDLTIVSGLAISASNSVAALETEVSGALSGEVATLNSTITSVSGVLNTKISNVSGDLSSRVSSLESSFASTGSNFVDLNSNNQTIEGTKIFNNRIYFKQLDLIPFTGNYSNPGGQNHILFTQTIEDYSFNASGNGIVTGDLFVTKIMQQNNIECIISSIIFTGSY